MEKTIEDKKFIGKVIFYAGIIGLTIQLVGCGSIPNAFLSLRPTFQETESSWPTLSTNVGRAVIYWPAFQDQGVILAPDSINLTIDNEKSLKTSIASGTFVFADLSPGSHVFGIKRPGLFWKKTLLSVTVPSAEITYVKICNNGWNLIYDLQVTSDAEARKSLKGLRHEYKRPLPLSDQKGARPIM